MGLKNCPSCNLMLFDTDTECIYCGWKQSEQAVEVVTEPVPSEPAETDQATLVETDETPKTQPTDEHTEHTEENIDVKNQVPDELEDIKKGFDAVLQAAQKQAAETVDIEDTIIEAEDKVEEEIVDIEDMVDDDSSSFTEEDYNNGIRYLDGKRFNLFDIITKHGAADKVSIIREIREVTETSLKDAVKLLDNSLDAFFEFESKNPTEENILNFVPERKTKLSNYAEPGVVGQVKNNIHRALAYNMIVRRGPDRRIQIIDELMRSEHISLPHATQIVDEALREYNHNTNSH